MSKAGRTAARERIRLERERAARRQRRNRALLIIGGALAVIVAAVIVLVVARPGQSTPTTVQGAFYSGPFPPVTLNADHTATAARAGVTSPTLDIYEDFQCPVCRVFEKANGGMVQRLAAEGKVRVVYHPFIIFLGDQPAQDNSVRAWAAAQCLPASHWLLYHNLLYSNQPPETKQGGFPVSLLLAIGTKAGVTSASFRSCVSSQRYAPLGVSLSRQIIKNGINGTPTVRLNGRAISLPTLVTPGSNLKKMILAAH